MQVKRLPKTRIGKILRKVMRQMADEKEYCIPSAIDNPLILEEIRYKLIEKGIMLSR